jgi:hypothetical protein
MTFGYFPPSVSRYPRGKQAPHNWQPVQIVLDRFGVNVSRGSDPVRRIDWEPKVVKLGRVIHTNTPAAAAWVPPPLVPGNGIGLIAVQARLSVRNLTVSKH